MRLIKLICISNPVGRPPLTVTNENLLEDIISLVQPKALAESKRNSRIISTPMTLNKLHEELTKKGHKLTPSGLYNYILPKRANTREGKRHKNSVAVKLACAKDDGRKKHVAARYCHSLTRNLYQLASTLGNSQIIILSLDDKARVPLGIVAANKQQHLLMSVKYRIKLPDHSFVVA